MTDKGITKQFHWVDGTPLNKSLAGNWRPGEPSNSFGNEDCVEMYGHWLPGKWNDNHCTSIRDYICEKKSGAICDLYYDKFSYWQKNMFALKGS